MARRDGRCDIEFRPWCSEGAVHIPIDDSWHRLEVETYDLPHLVGPFVRVCDGASVQVTGGSMMRCVCGGAGWCDCCGYTDGYTCHPSVPNRTGTTNPLSGTLHGMNQDTRDVGDRGPAESPRSRRRVVLTWVALVAVLAMLGSSVVVVFQDPYDSGKPDPWAYELSTLKADAMFVSNPPGAQVASMDEDGEPCVSGYRQGPYVRRTFDPSLGLPDAQSFFASVGSREGWSAPGPIGSDIEGSLMRKNVGDYLLTVYISRDHEQPDRVAVDLIVDDPINLEYGC